MQKEEIIILSSCFFIIVFLITFINPGDHLTGRVATITDAPNAGEIKFIEISVAGPLYWGGIYGEIIVNTSSTTKTNITFSGGTVTNLNVTLPCESGEVYASTVSNISLVNIKAGNKTDIDNYLSVNSTHRESGSLTFTNSSRYIVNGTSINNVPTTYTNVNNEDSTNFDEGLLNQSGTLVFLSNILTDQIGFDGIAHDYQMILPINATEITYYFFTDCETSTTTAGVNTTINITTSTTVTEIKEVFRGKAWEKDEEKIPIIKSDLSLTKEDEIIKPSLILELIEGNPTYVTINLKLFKEDKLIKTIKDKLTLVDLTRRDYQINTNELEPGKYKLQASIFINGNEFITTSNERYFTITEEREIIIHYSKMAIATIFTLILLGSLPFLLLLHKNHPLTTKEKTKYW